jgi:hypothetical protein
METLIPWRYAQELYDGFEPAIAYCLLIWWVGMRIHRFVFDRPTK